MTTGENQILLDNPMSIVFLDVFGVIALFASVALALTVRDAFEVTAVVGVLVLAARFVRAARLHANSSKQVRVTNGNS